MAKTSGQTARVEHLTANWNPHADDGASFELLVITDNEQRHTLPISATDLAALGSLLARNPVLRFDPQARTLIIGNLVGQRLPAVDGPHPPRTDRAARVGSGAQRTRAPKSRPAPGDPRLFEFDDGSAPDSVDS